MSEKKEPKLDTVDGEYTLQAESIALQSEKVGRLQALHDLEIGVVQVRPTEVLLAQGELDGPRIKMTPEGITLSYGIEEVGPTITMNEAGIRLSVGTVSIWLSQETGIRLAVGAETSVDLSAEAGVLLRFGAKTLSINEAGIVQLVDENVSTLGPEGLVTEAVQVNLTALSSFKVEAAMLTEAVAGVAERTAALNQVI